MKSARIVGAMAYGAAAAGAGLGTLALSGDALDVRTIREVAPLAFVIGALAGYGVVSSWPRSLGGAILTGVLTAVAVLVLFSALYLLGDALIEAVRRSSEDTATGGGAAAAVTDAMGRLRERLPTGAPLAVGAFAAAGLLLWLLGAIGRLLRRKPREQDA